MNLCIMTDSLKHLPFLQMLDKVREWGFKSIELGCGNWSEAPHIALDDLLQSSAKRKEYLEAIHARGLSIEALNCSGNQLAPNKEGLNNKIIVEKTFELANLLEVRKIIMMSGLPGGAPGDKVPNWITTSWPPSNAEILEWQWNEVALPYWFETVKKAKMQGIEKIAIENHGCQLVYNPSTLLRLRSAVGDVIGMNLDPSHLFWMGGDPIRAVRFLGKALYHIHAKDVRIERAQAEIDGVLDTATIDQYPLRTWNYVAVGFGHDQIWWKEFIAVVRMVGYDDAISLEMEDLSMDPVIGIEKSLQVLKSAFPIML